VPSLLQRIDAGGAETRTTVFASAAARPDDRV
jgi:hypothetical protein